MADITSIYGNPIKDAVARADIATNTQDISDLKDGLQTVQTEVAATLITDTASGAIASFPDGADNVPVKSLTVDIEPVQSGSGDPSPTNVRPISGHTSAKVTRTGKNLLKNSGTNGSYNGITWTINSDGSIAFSGTATATTTIAINNASAPLVIGKGQMTLVSSNSASYNPTITGVNFQSDIYVDGTYISTLQNGSVTRTYNGGLITVGISRIRINSGTVVPSGTVYYPQIEIGTTATAFEAYAGQTVTIDLDGTRYGGSLDVGTGVLTVTHGYYQFTGSETINGSATNAYINTSAFPTPMIAGAWYTDAKTVCDSLPKTNVGNGIRFGADNRTIYFYDLPDIVPAITDKASLDAWIASQKPCITYPIEAFTVQLSANEVQTLLGQNNIWSDAGDVEVEYRADTKLYIEKLTAPTEDDMIADHAISANTFFMVGNTLYRATTAIASGATITVGTNATRMSLADALNTLS